ncbi:MAG: PEP/pyruvate-binding domain-containing protein, partial [Gammaproteobacteria bacterium]
MPSASATADLSPASLIVPLPQAVCATRFGGKAANLAWLHERGLAIPYGWAIDAAWLREHLAGAPGRRLFARVDEALRSRADDAALATAGTELARFIFAQPLAAELEASLHVLLEGAPRRRWVVRSSAIGEDSAQASFAGQLDSVLHCRTPGDVATALRQVWASAWSAHCLAYQKHSGQRLAGVGVVLCEQVEARHAGVLFTDMTTGEGDQALRIEYTGGLADRLVAGEVTPAGAWLGRLDLQVREHLTDALRSDAPPMNEAVLATLARDALELERAWGAPLDIEWCAPDDSPASLVFVQARPITARSDRRVEVWSNANIAENFPDPVCPLVDSFV